jgi:hypothetical protein
VSTRACRSQRNKYCRRGFDPRHQHVLLENFLKLTDYKVGSDWDLTDSSLGSATKRPLLVRHECQMNTAAWVVPKKTVTQMLLFNWQWFRLGRKKGRERPLD